MAQHPDHYERKRKLNSNLFFSKEKIPVPRIVYIEEFDENPGNYYNYIRPFQPPPYYKFCFEQC